MDKDNSVVITGGRGVGGDRRGYKGDKWYGKTTIKKK